MLKFIIIFTLVVLNGCLHAVNVEDRGIEFYRGEFVNMAHERDAIGRFVTDLEVRASQLIEERRVEYTDEQFELLLAEQAAWVAYIEARFNLLRSGHGGSGEGTEIGFQRIHFWKRRIAVIGGNGFRRMQ